MNLFEIHQNFQGDSFEHWFPCGHDIGFHVAMATFSVQPEPIITLFEFYEPTPEGKKKTFYRQPRDIIKEKERERRELNQRKDSFIEQMIHTK